MGARSAVPWRAAASAGTALTGAALAVRSTAAAAGARTPTGAARLAPFPGPRCHHRHRQSRAENGIGQGLQQAAAAHVADATVGEHPVCQVAVLRDLHRILKPGGFIAFEVGEVRSGKLLLEELVLPAGVKAGLEPIIVMINVQEFTKTANAWGIHNRTKGTNTNRIVVFQSPEAKKSS